MLDRLANQLDFHSKALVLRAERQRVIASNIANADTPGYVARDLDFGNALKNATGMSSGGSGALTLPMAQPRGGAPFASTVGLGMGGSADGADARPGFIAVASVGGLPGSGTIGDGGLAYSIQAQPSMDGNSVDLDRERAAFADNAVHYEATLRFINGSAKTLLTAIQGQ